MKTTLLACSLGLMPLLTFAAGDQAVTKGQRVFTAGHSFHVWVAPLLEEIAKSAGISDHHIAGTSMIGGSTVLQHWQPNATSPTCKALISGQVDVLTLSPIWLPDEGIEKFAALGLEHNPDLRITVQEFWLPNDTYHPVYPLEFLPGIKVDHNAASMPELRKQHEKYFKDMDDYVRDINKKLGKDALLIVPVGQAVLALREKILAGQAPGLKTQAELFADDWGHPNIQIEVLAAYCHFAVIYRRCPVGLPVLKQLPNAELNRLLQELAWDAVIHHPMSGVSAAAASTSTAK